MNDAHTSIIKFLDGSPIPPEPIPEPDPVIPDPVIPTQVAETIPDSPISFATTQTGDIIFMIVLCILAVAIVGVIGYMLYRKFALPKAQVTAGNFQFSVNNNPFTKQQLTILLGLIISIFLAIFIYNTVNNKAVGADVASYTVKSQISCTVDENQGKTWSSGSITNTGTYPMKIKTITTEALDEKIEGADLKIMDTKGTTIYEDTIDKEVNVVPEYLVSPGQEVELLYSMEYDIDKSLFEKEAISVNFECSAVVLRSLIKDDTLYRPVLADNDETWSKAIWLDNNMNVCENITTMQDAYNNNISYFYVREGETISFKGIRAIVQPFEDAFGMIVDMSGEYYVGIPASGYIDTTSIKSHETCESMSFLHGQTRINPWTLGSPQIDNIDIDKIDSAYRFSESLSEIYYWLPATGPSYSHATANYYKPIYSNVDIFVGGIAYGNTDAITGNKITTATNIYPEPNRLVWHTTTKKIPTTDEIKQYMHKCPDSYNQRYKDGVQAFDTDGIIDNPGVDDYWRKHLFVADSHSTTGIYTTRYFSYAWPVKRSDKLLWGPNNDGYAWLRRESDWRLNKKTQFQYMNDDTDDYSDGPDHNRGIIVFSTQFGNAN